MIIRTPAYDKQTTLTCTTALSHNYGVERTRLDHAAHADRSPAPEDGRRVFTHPWLLSMDVKSRVLSVLADPRFHDDALDEYFDDDDAMPALARELGWQPVLTGLLDILRDPSLSKHWHDVAACLFCLDCHKLPLPCEPAYLTALLYDCLNMRPDLGVDTLSPDDSDNLVWSIVHQLKGVGYMSIYDPRSDPEVLKHQIIRE